MSARMQAFVGLAFVAGMGLALLLTSGVRPEPDFPPPKTEHLVEHILHSDDQLLACKEEVMWLKTLSECVCVPTNKRKEHHNVDG